MEWYNPAMLKLQRDIPAILIIAVIVVIAATTYASNVLFNSTTEAVEGPTSSPPWKQS